MTHFIAVVAAAVVVGGLFVLNEIGRVIAFFQIGRSLEWCRVPRCNADIIYKGERCVNEIWHITVTVLRSYKGKGRSVT